MTDTPNPDISRSIVLVGLMGAGKSYVGKRLAQRLNMEFVDADEEIEEAAGCTIPDIFELYGEEAFRDGERRVILRLLDQPAHVLATGGGAFMNEAIRDAIHKKGVSIWLHADLDMLVNRVRKGRRQRPLLAGKDPKVVLELLMEARYPTYAKADITIESDALSPNETVERAIQALAEHQEKGG